MPPGPPILQGPGAPVPPGGGPKKSASLLLPVAMIAVVAVVATIALVGGGVATTRLLTQPTELLMDEFAQQLWDVAILSAIPEAEQLVEEINDGHRLSGADGDVLHRELADYTDAIVRVVTPAKEALENFDPPRRTPMLRPAHKLGATRPPQMSGP